MRCLLLLSFLAALPTPALAQNITLDDLQGVTIHTVNSYEGTFKNDYGTAPGQFDAKGEIRIGPGSSIRTTSTRNVRVDAPKGTKNSQLSRENSGKIGTPLQASDKSGNILWVLDGNTLTRLRTFEVGGNLLKISFSKSASGLKCSVSAPFASEVGAGNTRDTSAMPGGGKVEILNVRQTRSSCRVTKA
jgi:hypothetical protein